jgi:hypothetical protein
MKLMVNSPSGVSSIMITHVALVEGFLISLVALTRCRTVNIHFDSGRDLLYHSQPSNPLVNLEYRGGHWLMDADASCRPKPYDLASFATSYRPSKDPKPVQKVSWATAHQMWGHPGRKTMTKLAGSVVGLGSLASRGRSSVILVCNRNSPRSSLVGHRTT